MPTVSKMILLFFLGWAIFFVLAENSSESITEETVIDKKTYDPTVEGKLDAMFEVNAFTFSTVL